MERHEIVSWAKFKGIAGEIAAKINPQTFLFRGHADEAWKLQSRFHRDAHRIGVDLAVYRSTILPDALHYLSDQIDSRLDLSDFDDLCLFLSILQQEVRDGEEQEHDLRRLCTLNPYGITTTTLRVGHT